MHKLNDMDLQYLKLGARQENLKIEEIIYFEGDINYTKIHLKSGKINIIAYTLKTIEEQLIDYKSFYRVHKKFIINNIYINDIEGRFIILKNEKKIPFSKRKKKKMNIMPFKYSSNYNANQELNTL